MSFKPLDMQISIPRTQEFSSMQQQANQRPIIEQNLLENQAAKQTEEQRAQSSAVEQSSKPQVRTGPEADARKGGNDGRKKKGDSADAGEQEQEIVHPYKGHHLDIKL